MDDASHGANLAPGAARPTGAGWELAGNPFSERSADVLRWHMAGLAVLLFLLPLLGFAGYGASALRRFLAGDLVRIDLTEVVEEQR